MSTKPGVRPARPYFSSGPCAKRPGWSAQNLGTETLGRSHRARLGKARLQEAIDRTRALLEVPDGYRIGIVPASDTGAVEMALWSLLGARPLTMLAWESFGEGWVADVVKQLKLDASVVTAPYGALPDLSAVDPKSDIVFTWNGTTSGVRVPNADWIAADREGLTICDATSAAFAQRLDWPKLDVVTFSWQKALGGEAAHGMLVLSPRAVERMDEQRSRQQRGLDPEQRVGGVDEIDFMLEVVMLAGGEENLRAGEQVPDHEQADGHDARQRVQPAKQKVVPGQERLGGRVDGSGGVVRHGGLVGMPKDEVGGCGMSNV